MPSLQFSEAGKRKMIDQLLDHHNSYLELYHQLGDIHFKEEADRIIGLLKKYFTAKSCGDQHEW